MNTPTTDKLDQSHVAYVGRSHEQAVYTCKDAARERGVTPAQVTKTMLSIDADRQVYAILLPGDCKLNIQQVRQDTDKKIRLIPRDQIDALLGLVVGAISPVDLLGRAHFLMDRQLLGEETVTMSAGIPEAGIGLSPHALAELLNATIGDYSL